MSNTWSPPGRSYHLRVFAISLVIVAIGLVGFLFGVRLEAIMPATGVIAARGEEKIRAEVPGLVELGWYEGELTGQGTTVRVRLDSQGNGVTEPGRDGGQVVNPPGRGRAVTRYRLEAGGQAAAGKVQFHQLAVGDELWPGQPLPAVRGEATPTPLVPKPADHWLVLKIYVEPGQAVAAGDAIALLAPLDPATHQPRALVAVLDVLEKHASDLEPGQTVRLYSTMYNQRLHGHAEAVLEKLEPLGEPLASGERRFRALAAVTGSPFPLRPGSSFKAEIVTGRKQVYRIILEQ